ncbi:MAG: SagB/ThcOx family dehydrogenase [Candidatus Micrarchaeota archaeon]|nr:SagB/ThcOx family dehydrogenase [Candidatus Micrarchaeota archaeon]
MRKYKASLWLRLYPDYALRPKLVLENFFTKKKYEVSDSTLPKLINFCSTFKSKNDITRYFETCGYDASSVPTIISSLVKAKILISSGSDDSLIEAKTRFWEKNNWSHALDFYMSIRDYPFLDYTQPDAHNLDNHKMSEYFKDSSPPNIYKNYKTRVGSISLFQNLNSFDKINIKKLLLENVVDSSPSKLPLSKTQVSDILFYTFGKTGTVKFPNQGEFLLKTSPSGGARHPIEAYVVILNSKLRKGVFHYSVEKNMLELINSNVQTKKLKNIIHELKNGPPFEVKAIIILSAIFERSMWRYREPRSYRVVLHDLGHLLETLKIVSKASNVKTYFGHGFQDQKLEKYLGIDSETESVLKFAALG